MNKQVISLSLLALTIAFQPAHSMNWISQPNKDRIAKYGPWTAAGTAAIFGGAMAICGAAVIYGMKELTTGNGFSRTDDMLSFGLNDSQGVKNAFDFVLRQQFKNLGYAGLSGIFAYLSSSDSQKSAPVAPNAENPTINQSKLSNVISSVKIQMANMNPYAKTTLKACGTILAAYFASKAAYNIVQLEAGCYYNSYRANPAKEFDSIFQYFAKKLHYATN